MPTFSDETIVVRLRFDLLSNGFTLMTGFDEDETSSSRTSVETVEGLRSRRTYETNPKGYDQVVPSLTFQPEGIQPVSFQDTFSLT